MKQAMAKRTDLWIRQAGHRVAGIQTGFLELDELTGGMHPSELVVVAGEPIISTSAFVLNIAAKVGMEDHLPVVIYTHNKRREDVAMHFLSATSGVPVNRLQSGAIGRDDWPLLAKAAGRLAQAPIFLNDSAPRTIEEIRDEIHLLNAESELALVVIDDIQLIRRRKNSIESLEIVEILYSLKSLADELKRPVIVHSQLSDMTSPQMDGWKADLMLYLSRKKDRRDRSGQQKSAIKVSVFRGGCATPRTIRLDFSKGWQAVLVAPFWRTKIPSTKEKPMPLIESIKACFLQIERWYESPGRIQDSQRSPAHYDS